MTEAVLTTAKKSRRGKGKMARPQKHVTMPEFLGDRGADGPANQRDLVIEDADAHEVGDANPNRVKRARRVDMLEVFWKRGTITTAGYNAAVKLRDAYDATEKAPGWPDNDRVQASPKPDLATAIQVDRLSRYHSIARHVFRQDRGLIDTVVLRRASLSSIPAYAERGRQRGLEHLRAALDRLAFRLGG